MAPALPRSGERGPSSPGRPRSTGLLDADGNLLYAPPVMSLFRVNVVARNPKREEIETPPVEALVDTGSELTWLPRDVLHQAGITPRRQRWFRTATSQTVTREVGYAILAADGYETADEVVFAEPGDLILLGVRTLEGFGVAVDNVGHRFVAQATIVAGLPAPARRD